MIFVLKIEIQCFNMFTKSSFTLIFMNLKYLRIINY